MSAGAGHFALKPCAGLRSATLGSSCTFSRHGSVGLRSGDPTLRILWPAQALQLCGGSASSSTWWPRTRADRTSKSSTPRPAPGTWCRAADTSWTSSFLPFCTSTRPGIAVRRATWSSTPSSARLWPTSSVLWSAYLLAFALRRCPSPRARCSRLSTPMTMRRPTSLSHPGRALQTSSPGRSRRTTQTQRKKTKVWAVAVPISPHGPSHPRR
mmetsp:Transcript_32723/g.94718  ORF Transcript_32723/g.94718 Transcript_32723/m.94718 type:complete len:212 (+) Transcript_32723:373-1008(+)